MLRKRTPPNLLTGAPAPSCRTTGAGHTGKATNRMSILRAIACIFVPPLAVIDKGCGSILIVLVLTLLGWVPGIIGAMVICTREH